MTASGAPLSSSNRAMSAWCEGRPWWWLPGKTETSFTSSATPGTYPGMVPIIPSSATRIPTRGGTSVVPAEKATRALASASSIASTSRRRSTSSRLRYRSSRTPGHDKTARSAMKEFLGNGKLVTLMLGHLTVDSYVGVIPVLYPLLIGRFHLTLATVGLVSLAYGGMAALSHPP